MSLHLEMLFRVARWSLLLVGLLATTSSARTVVEFDTSLGLFDVELYDDITPITVQNFLGYVNRGDYDSTLIHRAYPDFALQGGVYKFIPPAIPPFPSPLDDDIDNDGHPDTIPSEFHESNVRGTIGVVHYPPNGATSEWYFNIVDNSEDLDVLNGGYTVFGHVLGDMSVLDAIAAVPTYNAGFPFDFLPLRNFESTASQATADNLVIVNHIRVVPEPATLTSLAVGAALLLGCWRLGKQRR